MSTLSSTSAGTPATRVSGTHKALLLVAAVVGAVVVNELIALVFRGLVSTSVLQLQPPAIAVFTAVGVLIAALGWSIVRRVTRRPAAVLRWLVPAVLVLSLIPDIALLLPHEPALAVVGLMILHVTTVAVAVPLFRRAMPVS